MYVPTEEHSYDVAIYSDATPNKILARICATGYRVSFSEKFREQRARSTKAIYAYEGACNNPVGHAARDHFLKMLEREAAFAQRTMEKFWAEQKRLADHHLAVWDRHQQQQKMAAAAKLAERTAKRVADANRQ